MEHLSLIFSDGPHPLRGSKLDILVANAEDMFQLILHFYLNNFLSVLELLEGLGDPYDIVGIDVQTICITMVLYSWNKYITYVYILL